MLNRSSFCRRSDERDNEISVPIYQIAQNNYWWDLWVDGVKDKDLSIDRQDSISTMGTAAPTGDSSLTFLVAGPST